MELEAFHGTWDHRNPTSENITPEQHRQIRRDTTTRIGALIDQVAELDISQTKKEAYYNQILGRIARANRLVHEAFGVGLDTELSLQNPPYPNDGRIICRKGFSLELGQFAAQNAEEARSFMPPEVREALEGGDFRTVHQWYRSWKHTYRSLFISDKQGETPREEASD